jgi:hypothetical protein
MIFYNEIKQKLKALENVLTILTKVYAADFEKL